MLKCILAIAALVAAACGSDSRSDPSTPPPAWSNGGTIPITPLKAETERVKIAVNSTRVVYVPVPVSTDGEGNPVYLDCATDTDCSAQPGSSCRDRVCSTPSNQSTIFYVVNVAKNALATISLPCDGAQYAVEVYGAKGTRNSVQESWASTVITTPVSSTACDIAAPTWTAVQGPAFKFPTIYAGLPAPYDKFTVDVENLGYPWSAANWSATCKGAAPLKTTARSATFAAPAVAGAFTCEASFPLDHTLLVGDTPWELAYTSPPQTPVPSGGVPPP